MAEGMCSWLRDANNLAWRLDLVLRGVAGEALLDSYTSERRPQNDAMIQASIAMGRVSCTLDPRAAAERDAAMRSGAVPPPPPLPGIGSGVLHAGDSPLTGRIAVQGRIEHGLLDDVLHPRWVVVCAHGDPREALGEERMRFLEHDLRAGVVSLDNVRDIDGALTRWLTGACAAAVVARPDAYVFGAVDDVAQLPVLVDDLRAQLT